ncbi:MAG: FAD-dependent oxidoreductase [Spirochaetota bacterium]
MLKKTPDIIIVGGGITGCIAAVEAKKRGFHPLMIEKRPYLGREIAAYDHTFIRCDADDAALRRIPGEFTPLFLQHGGGEIVAAEGYIRQQLMAIIESHRIPVLFEAEAVALAHSEGKTAGIMIACPAGLCSMPSAVVLDATERGALLRMLGNGPNVAAGAVTVHAVFEMGVSGKSSACIASIDGAGLARVASENGLLHGSVHLHTTLRADTVVIDYAFAASSSGALFETQSIIDADARMRSVSLAAYLRANIPAFTDSRLTHIGFEAHIRDNTPNVTSSITNVSALPCLEWGFSLNDVADNAAATAAIINGLTIPSRRGNTQEIFVGRGWSAAADALGLTPYNDEALTVPLSVVTRPGAIPLLASFSADVCVAGIGAGGGLAMLAASERGASVIALDLNREPGGTYTAGRVSGYYEGYHGGVNTFVTEEAAALIKPAGGGGHGGLTHSNLLSVKARERGIRSLTATRVCGVRSDHGALTEILAANEDGLFSVKARVTIDATGDGDVAAFAGASYAVGDPHDGMMQSYSMWGVEVYPCPNFQANRFLTDPDIISPDMYSERLRAVSLGHRGNSPFHIAPMFTVREARRIIGEKSLTMRGILDATPVDDVIAVASTQADSHAHTTSDLAKIGTIGSGRPLRVRIPYGCFIPKGIDGLFVAAKAISGERDATSFCRMNADIKNAGYAVGAAAAYAVKNGCKVRDIDIQVLQADMRTKGILPEWAFSLDDGAVHTGPDDGGFAQFDRMLRLDTTEAVPILTKRFEQSAQQGDRYFSERTFAAMALAWHGSAAGGEYLADVLARAVAEGRHRTPPRLNAIRTVVAALGEGRDDHSIVNRLLIMAGRSGAHGMFDTSLAHIIDAVPGLGTVTPKIMPYDSNRGDIVSEPFYQRLRNIAFAVERHPGKALKKPMDALLRRTGITGYDTPMHSGRSPRYMLAYLEICLAAAAFLCGSLSGKRILSRYAGDVHCFLRDHARKTLAALR